MKEVLKKMAYFYFSKPKKSNSKSVLAAHMMASTQVWVFRKH
jgi:hypothetical protein